MEGDRTLMAWHGKNTESLEEVRFALTPYVERTLHMEVYDKLQTRWGHVLADEFELLRPASGS